MSIKALSTGYEAYLNGSVPITPLSNEASLLNVVVIVDDNSGSMAGTRAQQCAEKTRVIISECIDNRIPYFYATFGSHVTMKGACRVEDVSLSCNEGTQLSALTDAALHATAELIASVPSDVAFRVVYILNTDGEAYDGVKAGENFVSGYENIQKMFPNMEPARTFVLGIGAHHDQKVLAAMSVGEASYFNYPDGELQDMSRDARVKILPELSGARSKVCVKLNSTGEATCYMEDGILDLSGVRVSPEDTSMTLPDGTVYTISHEVLDPTDERYFDISIRVIQDDAVALAREIRSAADSGTCSQDTQDALCSKCSALSQRLKDLVHPSSNEKSLIEVLQQQTDVGMMSAEERSKWRSRVYATVRGRVKAARSKTTDHKAGARSVLHLCEIGLQSLRVGRSLSTEIERDYMELLGAGGFKHWSSKKKGRVTQRALEQANPDAIMNADEKAQTILSVGSGFSKEESVPEYLSDDEDATTSRERCWLTLLRDEDLTPSGDILCLVGYVPSGARKLPLCAVSSAKVLHSAILDNKIHICAQPMSFLTLRQLLLEGKEIARGPDGHPINVVVCFLPTAGSSENASMSRKLANCYSSIAASQLLTSRWIYTVGTREYQNGVLSTLMSLVRGGISEHHLSTLSRAVDGFCQTHAGSAYLSEVADRAAGFTQGESTSGEVSTPLVALADQMVLFRTHQVPTLLSSSKQCDIECFASSTYWRALLMRLLRDRISGLFTAYCSPDDKEADMKRRQKEIDAEVFVEILVQGLHMPNGTSVPDSLITCANLETHLQQIGAVAMQNEPSVVDSVDIGSVVLEEGKVPGACINKGVEIRNAVQEAPLDALSGSNGNDDDSSDTSDKKTFVGDIPDTLSGLVRWLLSLRRTLPPRGKPGTVLSGSEAYASAADSIRRIIVLRVLQAIKQELVCMVNASIHMMYQMSDGAVVGDDPSLDTLYELLDIEKNENGIRWLLSQIIIATKLRVNSRFRAEPGLRDMSAEALYTSTNDTISRKQEVTWETEESARVNILKKKFRRAYLSHPKMLAACPLRIRDEKHLDEINSWVKTNRGFTVQRTVSPSGVYTGMANNTLLTPKSPYFLKPRSPYDCLVEIFGVQEDRQESKFCADLHVVARQIFDSIVGSEPTESQYDRFHNQLCSKYPAHKMDVATSLPLWISFTLDTYWRDPNIARDLLAAQLANVQGDLGCAGVSELVEKELLWHSDPAAYLDQYFASMEKAGHCKLSLDEFLSYMNVSTEEDIAVAKEVHECMTNEIQSDRFGCNQN